MSSMRELLELESRAADWWVVLLIVIFVFSASCLGLIIVCGVCFHRRSVVLVRVLEES